MPILSSDIKYYKSAVGASEGGAITGTQITSAADNNLFPDLTSAERAAGGTRLRKFFGKNTHASISYLVVLASIDFFPAQYVIAIGLGIDHADDADSNQGNLVGSGAAATTLELVSDGADTRLATVVGENAAGAYLTEDIALNGVTPVTTAGSYLRVTAVYLDALSALRIVTVKRTAGATIGTIGINKKITWWWRATTDAAMDVGDIVASGNRGFWIRKTWAAGIGAGEKFDVDFALRGD